LLISYFKEEPVVIPMRIQIVFNQQIKLLLVFETAIGSAKVTAFEVRIYIVFLKQNFLLLALEFFEELPVVIDQRVNTFKFAQESFAVATICFEFVVNASEFFLAKILLEGEILAVDYLEFQFARI
jgi:hypothetical protein